MKKKLKEKAIKLGNEQALLFGLDPFNELMRNYKIGQENSNVPFFTLYFDKTFKKNLRTLDEP